MKTTVVGVVLAIAFLGILFVVARMNPHPTPRQNLLKAAEEVKSGFVGQRKLGTWELVCLADNQQVGGPQAKPQQPKSEAPMPLSLGPDGHVADQPAAESPDSTTTPASPNTQAAQSPATDAKPISLGRCRITQVFHGRKNPKQAILAVSFRLIGDKQNLGVIVRTMIPIGKKGDSLVLKLGQGSVKIPVVGCGKQGGCVAIAEFGDKAQAALLSARQAELILPVGQAGKPAGLRLAMAGFSPAVTAMRRAESRG